MKLPDYWLPRPQMNLNADVVRAFDQLLTQARSDEANNLIHYTLPAPKWQFLCYLADRHGIALHGSGDAHIQVLTPRQPVDLTEFGNQEAVYAAGDGLWAMFFAIVDRVRFPMSFTNACIRLADANRQISEPFYVFSISQSRLPERPWRTGVVYLLPPDTFSVQPPISYDSYEVRIPHLASLVPVTPFARLEVQPEDFPFLDQIRGHDDDRLQEYADAMQNGASWPD